MAARRELDIAETTELAIVDNCPVRRLGIAATLQARRFCVREIEDSAELLDFARSGAGDRRGAIICIESGSGADGIGALHSKFPQLAIVALLGDPSAASVRAALLAGATVALHIDAPPDVLADGVVAALNGHTLLTRAHAVALAVGTAGASSLAETITPAEQRWLDSLADGATIAEMASAAAFSEREMHRRLGALYDRLGVRNRSQALVTAARQGLLSLPLAEEA